MGRVERAPFSPRQALVAARVFAEPGMTRANVVTMVFVVSGVAVFRAVLVG
jgi:hypothetical protein